MSGALEKEVGDITRRANSAKPARSGLAELLSSEEGGVVWELYGGWLILATLLGVLGWCVWKNPSLLEKSWIPALAVVGLGGLGWCYKATFRSIQHRAQMHILEILSDGIPRGRADIHRLLRQKSLIFRLSDFTRDALGSLTVAGRVVVNKKMYRSASTGEEPENPGPIPPRRERK